MAKPTNTDGGALFSRDENGNPTDEWIWDELLTDDDPGDGYYVVVGQPVKRMGMTFVNGVVDLGDRSKYPGGKYPGEQDDPVGGDGDEEDEDPPGGDGDDDDDDPPEGDGDGEDESWYDTDTSEDDEEDIADRAAKMANDETLTAFEREYAIPLARAEVISEKQLKNGDTFARFRTGDQWDPERSKLHVDLVTEALSGKPAGLETPTLILMGGLTAAGKTSAAKGIDTKEFVVLNADEFKDKLPEYRGINATVVHEESSFLVEVGLRAAKANRQNILLDSTLNTTGSLGDGGAMGKAQEFKAAGYRVEVRFVDVPVEVSAERAARRYVTEQAKTGAGRYVPGSYIRKQADPTWGSKARKTFELMKASGLLDAHTLTDGR